MVIIPIFAGNSWAKFLIFIVSAMLILIFAPVNHPNLELSKEELLANKHLVKRILVFQMIGIGLLLLGSRVLPTMRIYAAYALVGVGVNAALVFLSKMTRQNVLK